MLVNRGKTMIAFGKFWAFSVYIRFFNEVNYPLYQIKFYTSNAP